MPSVADLLRDDPKPVPQQFFPPTQIPEFHPEVFAGTHFPEPLAQQPIDIDTEAMQRRIVEATALLATRDDPDFLKATTDIERLNRSNAIRKQLGLAPKPDFPTQEEVGFVERLKNTDLATLVPFAGSALVAADLWRVKTASERFEEGRPTAVDHQVMAEFLEAVAQDSREHSYGGYLAAILTEMPSFAIEMFSTAGVGPAAKQAATRIGKRLVRKGVSKNLSRAVAGTAKLLGSTTLRMPFFTHRVSQAHVEALIPEFAGVTNPEGNFEYIQLEPGADNLDAAVNALADVYIEIFSESTGEAIALIGGPLRRGVQKLTGKALPRIRIPSRSFMERLSKAGLHNPLIEVTEERIGEFLRQAGTTLGALDLPQELPSLKKIAAEFSAFALPFLMGVPFSGVGTAMREGSAKLLRQTQEKKDPTEQNLNRAAMLDNRAAALEAQAERQAGTAPDARSERLNIEAQQLREEAKQLRPPKAEGFTKDVLLTPEGAAAFYEKHPEAASQMAAVVQGLSRHGPFFALRELAPESGSAAWNLEERNELRDLLRGVEFSRIPGALEEAAIPEMSDFVDTPTPEAELRLRLSLRYGGQPIRRNRETGKFILPDGRPVSVRALKEARQSLKDDPEFISTPRGKVGTVPLQDLTEAVTTPFGPGNLIQTHPTTQTATVEVKGKTRNVPLHRVKDAITGDRLGNPVDAARTQLRRSVNDFAKHVHGTTFANPLDPVTVKLATKVVRDFAKVQGAKFADLVVEVASHLGSINTSKLGTVLTDEWNKLRRKNPNLDAPGNVDQILAARPRDRRLANPLKGAEARSLLQDTDVQRHAAGLPQPETFAASKARAAQRIAADRAAERQNIVDKGKAGQVLDMDETHIAHQLMEEEALEKINSEDPKQIKEAFELYNSYRETRAESGRAFAAGREIEVDPPRAVLRKTTEALLSPPQAVEELITIAKEDGKTDEVEKLTEQWLADIPKLISMLKKLGFDLNEIPKLAESNFTHDRLRLWKLVNAVQSLRGDRNNPWYEFWRNSILAGLQTQMVNVLSNQAHVQYHLTARRLLELVLNSATPGSGAARWGEMIEMLRGIVQVQGPQQFSELKKRGTTPRGTAGPFTKLVTTEDGDAMLRIVAGMMPGLHRAFRNAILSFDAEAPWLFTEIGHVGVQQIEEKGISIRGKKGRIVRMPQRMLLAADDFFGTLVTQFEVGAQAYRLAKREGLKGMPLQQRISELVMDTNSDAWAITLNLRNKLLFQERGDTIKRMLVFRGIKGLPWTAPFVTTPVNLIRLGVKMSPLGTAALVHQGFKGLTRKIRHGSSGLRAREILPDIADQIIGYGILMSLLDWYDPDDPFITGTRGTRRHATREEARRTYQPQSIRFNKQGDRIDFSRMPEPFTTALTISVDLMDAIYTGNILEAITSPFFSLLNQLENKTFLQQLGDMIEIIRSQDETSAAERLARWGSNFLASWMPNIVRSTARATAEEYPETRIWGDGQQFWENWLKRTGQKIIPGAFSPVPRIDIWGRTQPTSMPFGSPRSDLYFRIFSPMRIMRERITVGDRILMNWNNKNKDQSKDRHPQDPPPIYTGSDGELHFMADPQKEQFLRLAGQTADAMVYNLLNPDVDPEEGHVMVIDDVLTTARREAKELLVPLWEGKSKAVPPDPVSLGTQLRKEYLHRQVRAASKPENFENAVAKLKAMDVTASEALTIYHQILEKDLTLKAADLGPLANLEQRLRR